MVAKRSLKERLWAKVIIPEDLNACWLWTGAKSHKREGQKRRVIWTDDGTRNAARIVCEWAHGPPPTPEHEAGHICPTGENEICVNPRHLTWQTRQENENSKRRSKARSTERPSESATDSATTARSAPVKLPSDNRTAE